MARQLLFAGFALASLTALQACSSSDASPNSNPSEGGLPDCPVDAGGDSTVTGNDSAPDDVSLDDVTRDALVEADQKSGEPVADSRSCSIALGCNVIEGAQHMPICSPLTYGTNPPSSGNHYPLWAAYKTYTQPFLPGFWVHDLEHGAVVITYNCPGGCADDVARVQAFIDKLPADCGTPPRRIILLPDPDLDVRFAASAWGFTLKADCFDEPAFGEFVAAHYAHGPEDICADGVDPFTAGSNGTPLCP